MRKIHWPDFRFGPVSLTTVIDALTFRLLCHGNSKSDKPDPHEPDLLDARRPDCQAIQHSDQMHCSVCNLTWDMNDSDPPRCRR